MICGIFLYLKYYAIQKNLIQLFFKECDFFTKDLTFFQTDAYIIFHGIKLILSPSTTYPINPILKGKSSSKIPRG